MLKRVKELSGIVSNDALLGLHSAVVRSSIGLVNGFSKCEIFMVTAFIGSLDVVVTAFCIFSMLLFFRYFECSEIRPVFTNTILFV